MWPVLTLSPALGVLHPTIAPLHPSCTAGSWVWALTQPWDKASSRPGPQWALVSGADWGGGLTAALWSCG